MIPLTGQDSMMETGEPMPIFQVAILFQATGQTACLSLNRPLPIHPWNGVIAVSLMEMLILTET